MSGSSNQRIFSNQRFGSRRLLLILAFLLINSNSIIYSSLPTPGAMFEAPTIGPDNSNEVTWLVDSKSGQCLGTHGLFGDCGELSFWLWRRTGPKHQSVQLQTLSNLNTVENDVNAIHGECLGRSSSSELTIQPCSSKSTWWEFDSLSGMMKEKENIVNKILGASCISSIHESAYHACRSGYSKLKRVLFAPNTISSPSSHIPLQSSSTGSSHTWKCPITGQLFPQSLNAHISTKTYAMIDSGGGGPGLVTRGGSVRGGVSNNQPTSSQSSSTSTKDHHDQLFMGSGVFAKSFMGMNFNVYSMGWYVEADTARRDPSLTPFVNLPLEQLQQSQAFNQAVAASGNYDRTLFVKLAMTLKTTTLLEGFLNEIVLQPHFKEIVRKAASNYKVPVCPEGLEIMFTWRVPRNTPSGSRNPFKPSAASSGGEYLEVRIGDMYTELHEPGLAADFMRQFFADVNPVSPAAKKGFVTNFPQLLKA